MRVWSIHPAYLDTKGLVASWKEGIQGLNALRNPRKPNGKWAMFAHHPQLIRFKRFENPELCLSEYLHFIADEADRRNYNFNRNLILPRLDENPYQIWITCGQLIYEWDFLSHKVTCRTGFWEYGKPTINGKSTVETIASWSCVVHPMVVLIPGDIECWEKVKEF